VLVLVVVGVVFGVRAVLNRNNSQPSTTPTGTNTPVPTRMPGATNTPSQLRIISPGREAKGSKSQYTFSIRIDEAGAGLVVVVSVA
jgi:hypothetical protein